MMDKKLTIKNVYYLGGSREKEFPCKEPPGPGIEHIRARLIAEYPRIIRADVSRCHAGSLGNHFFLDCPLSGDERMLTVFFRDDISASRAFWNVFSFSYPWDAPRDTLVSLLSLSYSAWIRVCRETLLHPTHIIIPEDSVDEAAATCVSRAWNRFSPFVYRYPVADRDEPQTGVIDGDNWLERCFPVERAKDAGVRENPEGCRGKGGAGHGLIESLKRKTGRGGMLSGCRHMLGKISPRLLLELFLLIGFLCSLLYGWYLNGVCEDQGKVIYDIFDENQRLLAENSSLKQKLEEERKQHRDFRNRMMGTHWQPEGLQGHDNEQ